MRVQVTDLPVAVLFGSCPNAGLQRVGLQAARLWWRHQAVQDAAAQVGVTPSQVVSQVLHVHLLQLLVQQPVQH